LTGEGLPASVRYSIRLLTVGHVVSSITVRPRRLGISNYHLFWRRQAQRYLDPAAARLVLGQFKDDPIAMRDLRALLEEPVLGIRNARMTDDQVLDAVARLIAGGEVLLAREWPVHGGGANPPQASDQPDDSTPATPAPSTKSQSPENPSLPSNTDAATQAAALAAAAASGAPFCEH
jgi:hypothetical protein